MLVVMWLVVVFDVMSVLGIKVEDVFLCIFGIIDFCIEIWSLCVIDDFIGGIGLWLKLNFCVLVF